MALQWLTLLALAGLAAGATLPEATDYRTRGSMLYAGVSAGGAACADSWVTACGAQGPWLLRAAGDKALKIEAPSTGFALFKGKIIDCPETAAPVASVGGALEANGAFPADDVSPALVPLTNFALQPGGNDHSLLLFLTAGPCVYEFTLTQATGTILGVQPVQFVSWYSAAARTALSPTLLLAAAAGAAVLARLLA